jgi:hypothetical protein
MRFTLAAQTLGSVELIITRLCWQRGSIAIRKIQQQRDRSSGPAPFIYLPAASRARSWQWR